MTFTVEVSDANALLTFARERYRECWGAEMDEDFPGQDLVPIALVESIAYSNLNPSPDVIGIEYLDDLVKEKGKS